MNKLSVRSRTLNTLSLKQFVINCMVPTCLILSVFFVCSQLNISPHLKEFNVIICIKLKKKDKYKDLCVNFQ